MTFRTEKVCQSLDDLDKVAAIRAIHEALLHLQAGRLHGFDCLDDRDVLANLQACMKQAGHIGYV